MTLSTRTLYALTTLVLFPTGAAEEVVFAPQEETTLTRSFSSDATYSLDEFVISLDGEEIDHGETPELEIRSDERVVVTDELLGVENGRPTKLRRTYDELARSVTYSSPSQEEDLEEVSVCDLEGSTVLFLWDEEDESFTASDEDEALDDDVLDDLIEDMDWRQLLPDEEVEIGDSWSVDVDAYSRLMWPGGFLHFYTEGGEYEDGDSDGDREMVENLEGEGSVELVDVREEDGVSVAVLQVRFEVSSSSSEEMEGPTGSEAERTLSMSREVEGTVLWDIEGAHLLSAEVEADADLEVEEAGVLEGPDGEAEFTQTRVFSGSLSYVISIEAG